jgi:hypothetical protein
MEVCDLDSCDFIETRFKEFALMKDFLEASDSQQEKGILFIGYFSAENYTPHNHYSEFTAEELSTISRETVEQWKRGIMEKEGYNYCKMVYWYLDEFSCLSISRDREWMKEAIPKIKETWETIVAEKNTGFQHRKPVSRTKKALPFAGMFEQESLENVKVIKM